MDRLDWMWVLGAAALASAVLVITQRFHGRWTVDQAGSAGRKHHEGSPSRVAVLALLPAVLLAWWWMRGSSDSAQVSAAQLLGALVLGSMPAVLLGLADDITQSLTPLLRMLGAAAAALLAMLLLGNVIPRIGLPGVDAVVAWAPVGVVVTVLMVAGFTNAMNIIDGLNGLSSGLGILMCAATGWLAWRLGDPELVLLCGVLGAALAGFFVVNFPRGWLFLGDGGAYFVGFMLAQIWILMVRRHEEVSPWIVVAIGFQPTMETIFSIVRRRWLRRRRPGQRPQAMQADRLHLHSLVYRRRTLQVLAPMGVRRWVANAAASVWVLVFSAVPVGLALLGPSTTLWGALVLAAGVAAYLWWFKRLIGPIGRGAPPATGMPVPLGRLK